MKIAKWWLISFFVFGAMGASANARSVEVEYFGSYIGGFGDIPALNPFPELGTLFHLSVTVDFSRAIADINTSQYVGPDSTTLYQGGSISPSVIGGITGKLTVGNVQIPLATGSFSTMLNWGTFGEDDNLNDGNESVVDFMGYLADGSLIKASAELILARIPADLSEPYDLAGPVIGYIEILRTDGYAAAGTGRLRVGPSVPEPATWFLLLFGMTLIGALLRNDQRSKSIA